MGAWLSTGGRHVAGHARRLRGRVAVNGAHLAYERVGSGPPVVFVPSPMNDRRIWDKQLAPFADRYEVIRYDPRGRGRSSLGPHTQHPAEDMALHDLASLLDVLEVQSTALIGIGNGAEVALKLAGTEPTRVRALVLTNARVRVAGMLALLRGYSPPPPRRFRDEMTRQERTDFWAAWRHIVAMRIEDIVAERLRAWPDRPSVRYGASRHETDVLTDKLADIVVPTLLVHSDWTGALQAAQDELLVAKLTAGEVAVVPRSTFWLPLQPADAYNQIVLSFLDRHYLDAAPPQDGTL